MYFLKSLHALYLRSEFHDVHAEQYPVLGMYKHGREADACDDECQSFSGLFSIFLLLYLVLSAICIKKVLDSHVPF